jgi:hypothetical protein
MRLSRCALLVGALGVVNFGCGASEDSGDLDSIVSELGVGDTKELVTCVFNSKIPQECSSRKGSCKGTGACTVEVLGLKGEKIDWKSSCGSTATSLVDGVDEKVFFDCAQPPDPPPPQVKELVLCRFNSKTTQACYASNGAGCKGVGSCFAQVIGQQGEKIFWKSTCGGYGTTLLDGVNDTLSFDCAPIPPPPPPPQLKNLGDLVDLPFHEARTIWNEKFERQYLATQLTRAAGVVTNAANRAQLPRPSFHRLMKRHGLKGAPG